MKRTLCDLFPALSHIVPNMKRQSLITTSTVSCSAELLTLFPISFNRPGCNSNRKAQLYHCTTGSELVKAAVCQLKRPTCKETQAKCMFVAKEACSPANKAQNIYLCLSNKTSNPQGDDHQPSERTQGLRCCSYRATTSEAGGGRG